MMRVHAGKLLAVADAVNVRARTPALQPVWRPALHWMAMMRNLAIFALILVAAAGSRPQQVGQNKAPGEPQNFTLKVQSKLVVEAVEVKDKQGNFIHGLTAKDFVLTEDGVPQTIRYCEHQDLSEIAKPLPPMTSATENVTIYNRLARESIAPESMDNERYKNRRLLALYFDMTALPPADQMRALDAAQKFVRTQMTTADMVSIMRYDGGAVDILQDFTDDRNRLLSILETMVVGRGPGYGRHHRRCQQRRHGRGLRAGRQRVQRLQHRPATGRAANRGAHAGAGEREEVAALFCQRTAAERHRQPGADARDSR